MRNLSLNERRLVELIYRAGRIARVELAAAADLTGASVTRLIATMLEEKVLEESVLKDGARGQPKRLLALRREGFCAAGFYLFASHIEAVLVDFGGGVLKRKSIPTIRVSARKLVEIVQDTTHEFLTSPSMGTKDFAGVGLALPGNFGSFESSVNAHESFLELDGSALRNVLEAETDWAIFLENDGTAVAIGEYLFGNHQARTLFLLHVGYGLGGGAVLNGRPYRGAKGNACLPGALFPYGEPRPTLTDLEQALKDAGPEHLTNLRAGSVASEQHEVIDRWTQRATSQLEHAVRIVSGMFDPELIVLGGAMPTIILARMAVDLAARDIEGPSRGLVVPKIEATTLGDLNGPIGAASIPFFNRFFLGSTPQD